MSDPCTYKSDCWYRVREVGLTEYHYHFLHNSGLSQSLEAGCDIVKERDWFCLRPVFTFKKTEKNPSRVGGQDHLGDCDFHQRPPTFDNPDSFATGKFQWKLVLKLMFSSQFPENTHPHPLEVQTMEIFIWRGSPLQKRKTTCSFSNLISTKHSSVWWYEVNLLHIFFSLLKSGVYGNYFFLSLTQKWFYLCLYMKNQNHNFSNPNCQVSSATWQVAH